MLPSELILKKRRGGTHTRDEIGFLVDGFTSGQLPDYQMSAWLMATCFKGLTSEETAWLTEFMMNSGRILDFSFLGVPAVDKHSTGGVGDKTSLILAPLVAAAGVPVPMMAGRGLGHTGGTLDKLEAIRGFNVRLDLPEFRRIVATEQVAIIGQTKDICPADLKLYSLRDVTGTVDSIPLICASIMSKKLAEGISGLALDVKFGSGAFMKTFDDAVALAKALAGIGSRRGVRVVALITSMNQPMGRFIGNGCEVRECIEILQGKDASAPRPELYADTRELSMLLASHMLVLANHSPSVDRAREKLEELLKSGAAWRKFEGMCRTQGAPDPMALPVAKHEKNISAPRDGYINKFNVEGVGLAGIELGAGRRRSDDVIDHSAGIEMCVRLGDKVSKGQPIFRVFGNAPDTFNVAEQRLLNSVTISDSAPKAEPLVAGVLTADEVVHVF